MSASPRACDVLPNYCVLGEGVSRQRGIKRPKKPWLRRSAYLLTSLMITCHPTCGNLNTQRRVTFSGMFASYLSGTFPSIYSSATKIWKTHLMHHAVSLQSAIVTPVQMLQVALAGICPKLMT